MRCAVVNLDSTIVENLIIADPSADPAPDGFALIALSDDSPVSIGWTYDFLTGVFTPEVTLE